MVSTRPVVPPSTPSSTNRRFHAFDLIHLDGDDLTALLLEARRRKLPELLKDSGLRAGLRTPTRVKLKLDREQEFSTDSARALMAWMHSAGCVSGKGWFAGQAGSVCEAGAYPGHGFVNLPTTNHLDRALVLLPES